MTYLFRAYSDDSQGVNTPTLFAPQAAKTHLPVTSYEPSNMGDEELGKKLKTALNTRKLESPFVFFTASFMFAVQIARARKLKGEKNIFITAIDISTAWTPAGKASPFQHVPPMLQQLNIRQERADGSEKDYRDIFLTMDCVLPGAKSKTVSFDQLEAAGLYQLYPALTWGRERGDGRTRLGRNSEDPRAFHFRTTQALTMCRVNLAAILAATFAAPGQQVKKVDPSILAYFLAFQERSFSDSVLRQWIQINTFEVINLDEEEEGGSVCEEAIEAMELEEVQQYNKLNGLFLNRHVLDRSLSSMAVIDQSNIHAESAAWSVWSVQQRNEYRAKKEARPDYDPNRERRGRSGRDVAEGHGADRSLRDALYVARRASKEWLPRDQYVAQRDARRAYRDVRGGDRSHERFNRSMEQPSTVILGPVQPGGISRHRRYRR